MGKVIFDPRNIFLTIAYFIAIVLVFLIFQPYISFMILGVIVVMFLYPLNKRVKRWIENDVISALSMTAFSFLLVFLPLFFLVLALVDDARNIYNQIVELNLEDVSERMSELLGFELELGDIVTPLIIDFRSYIAESIPNILGFATEFFIKIFVMLFVIYYGFKEGKNLVENVMDSMPFTKKQRQLLLKRIKDVVAAVLYGNFLIAILQGLAGGLGFWVLGLPNPVFWGFIMGILSFVPVVGPPLVWGIAGVWLIYEGSVFAGISLLVYGTVVIMNIDNILRPKLIGGRADMHPLVVLVGILGGITLFGVIGFILGPIVLALAILLIEFFNTEVINSSKSIQKE